MLESFLISGGTLSGKILYAFVTDFLRKKPWEIKRTTFSFILYNKDINKTVYKQTSIL